MDKGQHLRLVITEGTTTTTDKFVAMATDLTVHLSAQTEDSTTKDTTDSTGGNWLEYEVTSRTGDIQFSALVAVLGQNDADANGKYLEDFIDMVSDTVVNWKLLFVGGNSNRVKSKTLCTGQGKLTNLQVSAPNRQKGTYSGSLNIYGPVTVGND